MARRWREMYDQQAELARRWIDSQARLVGDLAGVGVAGTTGGGGDVTVEAAAMAELWRSWAALGGSLGRHLPGFTDAAGTAAETLGRLLDPVSLSLVGGSQVGEAIRRMTEGPRFADVGAVERRMARVMELWQAVQLAARTYEGVVAGAWVEANQRFAREVGERYRSGKEVPSGRDALRLWLDIANQTLLQTHRSPRFLEAQGQLLRDGMEFLLAERELVEHLVEPIGAPTRSEIDEVHRSVQELKRRVRALEKAADQRRRAEAPHPEGARQGEQP
jgi:hypothetical protein